MMEIGICDGAASSRGRAINEAGDVAGWCFFPQVNGYPNGHHGGGNVDEPCPNCLEVM